MSITLTGPSPETVPAEERRGGELPDWDRTRPGEELPELDPGTDDPAGESGLRPRQPRRRLTWAVTDVTGSLRRWADIRTELFAGLEAAIGTREMNED